MKVVHVTLGNLYGYFMLGFHPQRNTRKGRLVLSNFYTNEKLVSQDPLNLIKALEIENEWEDTQG
jgi:hypothetical protein